MNITSSWLKREKMTEAFEPPKQPLDLVRLRYLYGRSSKDEGR